jgi:hypothetical protein
MLTTPLTILFKLNFALNLFLVFFGPVIDTLAHAALKLYQLLLYFWHKLNIT